MIFGIVWWLLIFGIGDCLMLGWLVRPHYDRSSDGEHYSDREHYWPGWALAWAVIVTTVILWLGGINLPVLVWQNPMNTFVGIIIYGFTGVVWSIIHWWLWRGSERQRNRLAGAYASWKNRADASETIDDFRQSSIYYPYGWNQDFPMILTWVLFWPLDILFYILGDFIFNLASAIGRKIAGIYSAIGKSIDHSVIGK